MSTNFDIYSIGAQQYYADMKASDLHIGQTLYRLITPSSGWDKTTPFKVVEYTVENVLKTRVVLKSVEPRGTQGKQHELRLIVNSSKYSMFQGAVTVRREGDPSSYRSTAFQFFTEDSRHLVDRMIEQRDKDIASANAERDAQEALKKIIGHLRPTLESVEEAMQALGVLADDLRSRR